MHTAAPRHLADVGAWPLLARYVVPLSGGPHLEALRPLAVGHPGRPVGVGPGCAVAPRPLSPKADAAKRGAVTLVPVVVEGGELGAFGLTGAQAKERSRLGIFWAARALLSGPEGSPEQAGGVFQWSGAWHGLLLAAGEPL